MLQIVSPLPAFAALGNPDTAAGWGLNDQGQVGDGTTVSPKTSPVQAGTMTSVSHLAGGKYHSLAVDNGAVKAWGSNRRSELTTACAASSCSSPVSVTGLTGAFTQVAAGAGVDCDATGGLCGVIRYSGGHSMALKSDGTVWTWGANEAAQIGDGTGCGLGACDRHTAFNVTQTANPANPNSTTPWGTLPSITAIAAAGQNGIALTDAQDVYVWGQNGFGQSGDGGSSAGARWFPSKVVFPGTPGTVNITAVAGGGTHILALQDNGQIWGWGNNADGQVGVLACNRFLGTTTGVVPVWPGTVTGCNTPHKIVLPGNDTGVAIAAGLAHSVALGASGKVYAWGNNGWGQLGDDTLVPRRLTPVKVIGLSGVTVNDVSAGSEHSMAKTSTDDLYMWGANHAGQQANGATNNLVGVLKAKQVTSLSAFNVKGLARSPLAYHALVWFKQ